jgi:hypothetical protein
VVIACASLRRFCKWNQELSAFRPSETERENFLVTLPHTQNQRRFMSTTKISAEEAMATADEAYVFGYPLVLMEITRTS